MLAIAVGLNLLSTVVLLVGLAGRLQTRLAAVAARRLVLAGMAGWIVLPRPLVAAMQGTLRTPQFRAPHSPGCPFPSPR